MANKIDLKRNDIDYESLSQQNLAIAEKRIAIEKALRHPLGQCLSDREIARHFGVHHSTVAIIRQKLEKEMEIQPLSPEQKQAFRLKREKRNGQQN